MGPLAPAEKRWGRVGGLRLRGRCRRQHTERLHLELAGALRRGSEIVRQAAKTVGGLGHAEEIGYLMAARDCIDAETRRVLRLHAGTAAITVPDLYASSAQQN